MMTMPMPIEAPEKPKPPDYPMDRPEPTKPWEQTPIPTPKPPEEPPAEPLPDKD